MAYRRGIFVFVCTGLFLALAFSGNKGFPQPTVTVEHHGEKKVLQEGEIAKGGEASAEEDMEQMVEDLEDSIKSAGLLEDTWIYLAAATNDSSICYNTDDPDDCLISMKYILLIKYIGEGKAESIEDPNLQKLSLALKDDNSKGLSGYALQLYKGIKDSDISLIDSALRTSKFTDRYGPPEPVDSQIFLNLYYGFLNRTPTPKIPYDINKVNLNDIIGYKILFSPEGPKAVFDSSVRDMALFCCVKEFDYPAETAELIKDPAIKALALDPEAKKLEDYFP